MQSGGLVKAVPSYKYKDKKWFYLLQKKLTDELSGDGQAWLAKRKEEEPGTLPG